MSELIQPKHGARVHIEKFSIIKDVNLILSQIPNLHLLKNDIELLKYIVSLVESKIVSKVKDKLKASDITFQIFLELFPNMSNEEKELVQRNIEYLVNNNQIQKVSLYKKVTSTALSFFSKSGKN